MPPIAHLKEWGDQVTDRQCGSCHACCIWLGITELRKWTGQTCKHLSGTNPPDKRCSIYNNRPSACSEYECLWRVGYGPDWLQPSQSGILITPYKSEMTEGRVAITMMIFDERKAEPIWQKVMTELLSFIPNVELRIVWIAKKKGILAQDGVFLACKLLPPTGFESLVYEVTDEVIGHYEIREEW